jgi:Rod binding domain-containing protein
MGISTAAAPVMSAVDPDLKSLAWSVHHGDPKAIPALARQFESIFLSQLLKEMRQTSEDGEGLFGKDPGDVQGGLFDQMMGKHLAEAGGIGLASMLTRQLQPTSPATTVTPGTTPCNQIQKKYHAPV